MFVIDITDFQGNANTNGTNTSQTHSIGQNRPTISHSEHHFEKASWETHVQILPSPPFQFWSLQDQSTVIPLTRYNFRNTSFLVTMVTSSWSQFHYPQVELILAVEVAKVQNEKQATMPNSVKSQ